MQNNTHRKFYGIAKLAVCGIILTLSTQSFAGRKPSSPKISSQPASISVNVGQAASFSVSVSNATTATYQWRKNGVNIAGANASTYKIASVVAGDAGSYSVAIIANSTVNLTSSNATLTINLPKIASQPASVTVNAGQVASFSVSVSGALSVSYQWRKNGSNISGANGATYSIANSAASDAAAYSVDIMADGTHLVSNNAQLTVNVAPPMNAADFAWYDQNLKDAEIIAQAKVSGADGVLDRRDTIAVLRAAGLNSGTIDANSLADLRLLVSNGSHLGMPAYVVELSGNVVNYNVANARYQGSILGNLVVGDAVSKLDLLIRKWFLGEDVPDARAYDGTDVGSSQFAYFNSIGSMFVNGKTLTDIVQGNVGDCYFLASMGSVLSRNPAMFDPNIIDNSDGTYTVRFFRGSSPHFVTVSKALPVSGTRLVFQGNGRDANNAGSEIWASIVERGYAQINEEQWIGQSGLNSYQGLTGGSPSTAFGHLTGHAASILSISDSNLQTELRNGKMTMLTSKSSGTTDGVVSWHVYTLVSYDGAGTYTLYNPWGSYISLNYTQIANNFAGFVSGQ